ncbi:MAG: lysophospholipid acyltransferase family protein [Acidobacteriota bacterium]|nr:lysophospholipid acyltransferase family protein [Acidobacteriota bacterium]
MPLEPLTDTSGPLATLKATTFLVLGFAALMFINLLQLSSLVLLPFSKRAFRAVNRWCADTWWGLCVTVADRLYKVEVIFTGDDVPMCENALVAANHQQMPDIPAIMKFARTKDRLGDLKFFVKKQLKWVPGMGWGMQFLDCLYIDRDWSADRETIRKTFSRLVDDEVPVYLVSFVEGTRLTLPKLAAAREYAESHDLRQPIHTLVPRTKGFAASIEGLRSHIDAVYDLTIAYEDGVPSLWQYLKGLVRRIHVHVRRFPINDLPDSADDVRQWLLDRWQEKDELLEHFYTTGSFPSQSLTDSVD